MSRCVASSPDLLADSTRLHLRLRLDAVRQGRFPDTGWTGKSCRLSPEKIVDRLDPISLKERRISELHILRSGRFQRAGQPLPLFRGSVLLKQITTGTSWASIVTRNRSEGLSSVRISDREHDHRLVNVRDGRADQGILSREDLHDVSEAFLL